MVHEITMHTGVDPVLLGRPHGAGVTALRIRLRSLPSRVLVRRSVRWASWPPPTGSSVARPSLSVAPQNTRLLRTDLARSQVSSSRGSPRVVALVRVDFPRSLSSLSTAWAYRGLEAPARANLQPRHLRLDRRGAGNGTPAVRRRPGCAAGGVRLGVVPRFVRAIPTDRHRTTRETKRHGCCSTDRYPDAARETDLADVEARACRAGNGGSCCRHQRLRPRRILSHAVPGFSVRHARTHCRSRAVECHQACLEQVRRSGMRSA